MDFLKYLFREGKITGLHMSYVNQKKEFLQEKNLTVEDILLLHRILPEREICESLEDYSGGSIKHDPILEDDVSEKLKEFYSKFPNNAEIIPVRYDEVTNILYVASYRSDRDLLAKRVEAKLGSYRVELLYPLKIAYHEKKMVLDGKYKSEQLEGNFLPDDKLLILFIDAIQAKATDVHMMPLYNPQRKRYEYRIAFRVATELEPWNRFILTAEDNQGIANCLVKRSENGSMNDINTDSGVSQTIKDLINDGNYSGRITVSACEGGYHSVTRIHENNKTAMKYEELGFAPEIVEQLKIIFYKESGLTLLTGHVGSGKNTTFYAGAADRLTNPKIKMVEYSSPVEVRLPCVQYDYRDSVDLLLANVKRAKKEDLDIAFVGEIPSKEVAFSVRDLVNSNIATYTTTHLDRCWHAPHKFFELFGYDEYKDLLSQVNGVINQKMFKMLCPECRVEQSLNNLTYEEHKIAKALKLEGVIYKPRIKNHCHKCKGGYVVGGLKPFAEILYFDESLVDTLIRMDTPTRMEIHLKEYAIKNGLSMEYYVRKALLAGEIDLAQVKRREVVNEITFPKQK